MKNLTLITGGVRSGKSSLAESMAHASGLPVHYLATMPHLHEDEEQIARIARHQARRPNCWQTIECPYNLLEAIEALPNSNTFCLIDCLSLFVNNTLLGLNAADQDHPYLHERALFEKLHNILELIRAKPDIQFVMVSNEVGWGIVPESQLGRAFRDMLGLVNQEVAKSADTVYLTCSGLPLRLKPSTI